MKFRKKILPPGALPLIGALMFLFGLPDPLTTNRLLADRFDPLEVKSYLKPQLSDGSLIGKSDLPEAHPANHWEDRARFLAGLPLPENSPLRHLTTSRHYQKHRQAMDRFWKRVQEESVDRMRIWRRNRIPVDQETRPALYPLSGADFVNLHTMFPRARGYLMFALEKPGFPPDPLKLKSWQIAPRLASLRRVIASIASRNYFYSRSMRDEMREDDLSGITPALMVFASRLGLQVQDVRRIGLDADGFLHELNRKGTFGDGRRPVVRGVRIRIRAPGDSQSRSLVYLQIRVARDTLYLNHPVGKFLWQFSDINTMLKSAVYLLHWERYAGLRNFLLLESNVVVQDDSGIPFRFFTGGGWNIRLFGDYVTYRMKIGGLGQIRLQADLLARYKKERRDIEPVPFRFGYGALRRDAGRSTLMLLTRRRGDSAKR